MPPKKTDKEPEPTDRTTRSRNNADRPAPKYTYTSEEEEDNFEENFNPNIDLTSTGHLPRIPAQFLPPEERRSFSPTEFDIAPARVADRTINSTLFHSV